MASQICKDSFSASSVTKGEAIKVLFDFIAVFSRFVLTSESDGGKKKNNTFFFLNKTDTQQSSGKTQI